MSYLVFDIETVPDLTVWTPPAPDPDPAATTETPPNGEVAAAAAEPPKKKSRSRKKPIEPGALPFAPLCAHRAIAIGFVWLEDDLTFKGMSCVGTSSFKDDERALLAGWSNFAAANRPTLVGWNSRGFDAPVLSLRMFRHGVSQQWFDREYRNRYGDRHLDLFDIITEYGALGKTGYDLDTMCRILGLPHSEGMDGSKVHALFTQPGGVETIETYCMVDALKQTFVLFRYLLMRGRVEIVQYRQAAQALGQQCRMNSALVPFVSAIDWKRLLLED